VASALLASSPRVRGPPRVVASSLQSIVLPCPSRSFLSSIIGPIEVLVDLGSYGGSAAARHRILPVYEGEFETQAQIYANGEDMSNPLLSPVYGDFSTFPPSQLVSGTRDLLLSPTLRAHRKLRNAGRVAELLGTHALLIGWRGKYELVRLRRLSLDRSDVVGNDQVPILRRQQATRRVIDQDFRS